MDDVQRRAAAKHFVEYWDGRGYEKGESQKFWLSLLADVFGVEHPAEYITFEDQVHLDHTSFIDGYIPETHVLIEQKGIGKDLRKPIKQSDGTLLKPIQQAQRYASVLPYSQRPRWIIVCNFECFHVYDMEHPQSDPTEIWLKDLPTQYYLLEFLVRKEDLTLQKEMEISIQAGELVGRLYDAFLKEYKDPNNERSLKSLNALCVRLVFCLYAEDAGIFGRHMMFHDYLLHKGLGNARQALIELFRVLDTKIEDRDPYMEDELASFPYVNGGLFSDENIEIPRLNETIYDLLLNKASASFDWSDISPTIFGAVFESTLNPETRRSGGMHYTSIENIHKVIDPLFLDELKNEFEDIKSIQVQRTREQKLRQFQGKISSLYFLDPAAGSGNFLTESYLCLRKLENEVINLLQHGQITMGMEGDYNPIKVSIDQFYGIEINDFAATVAKTALWIAESQMMKRTEDIVHMPLDFLPLKSYVNIVCENALKIDWSDVIPRDKLNYIMGNPPFIGAQYMNKEQKADLMKQFPGNKRAGVLDYVSGWYQRAADYIQGTTIRVAFVSTNSITQGEQVPVLWKHLFEDKNIYINFAYRTFQWDNEANAKAQVHCVIVGFSVTNSMIGRLYNDTEYIETRNITPYLTDGPSVFIESRKKPICDVPMMTKGCQPTDGGNLIIEDDELVDFISKEPNAQKYIKRLVGAREFINQKNRWCLWLVGVSPTEIRKMPLVMERIDKVREMRLASTDEGTRKLANTPSVFRETYNPDSFIIVPSASSERRRYIPLGFMGADTISTNLNLIIPDATLYHFGVLTSNVHMAWMRTVCGRLKSDYRYSKEIVYNNFPWPIPSLNQQEKIEQTAQMILDARALYPDASLADLYDELTMPPELRKAHQQNDRAVMEAYGMPIRETTESSCVAELMRRYQELIAKATN